MKNCKDTLQADTFEEGWKMLRTQTDRSVRYAVSSNVEAPIRQGNIYRYRMPHWEFIWDEMAFEPRHRHH